MFEAPRPKKEVLRTRKEIAAEAPESADLARAKQVIDDTIQQYVDRSAAGTKLVFQIDTEYPGRESRIRLMFHTNDYQSGVAISRETPFTEPQTDALIDYDKRKMEALGKSPIVYNYPF
jgi:hypothetical protein